MINSIKKYLIIIVTICLLSLVSCTKDTKKEKLGPTLIAGEELNSNEYVKWEGRYEYLAKVDDIPAQVALYHTATGFTITFYGSKLVVDFYVKIDGNISSRTPYYNIALDDETLPNPDDKRTISLNNGYNTITIVEGLEEKIHTIKCLKMNEAYDAYTSIYNLETDGYFLKRNHENDQANFRFMFVCASGGSGFGSLAYGTSKSQPSRTSANSSSLHAFNYLTSRMFDADVQFVATSGWGVVYPKPLKDVMDYTGITTSNSVNGAKTTSQWDYNSWIPDVIIFNIGGNDTTSSNFDLATYQKGVQEMVTSLHEHYPNAKMIWTHTGSNAGSYAVSALTDVGIMAEGYMSVVIIPKVGAGETGSGTYGASNHNSIKTHIDTSNILAEALINLGYPKIRENIEFTDFEKILKKFN